jgi:hypothetical protein
MVLAVPYFRPSAGSGAWLLLVLSLWLPYWSRAQSPTFEAVTPLVKGSATALTTDATGNVYVAGSFGDTLHLGALTLHNPSGTSDGFVAKRNAAGTYLWAVPLSGRFGDYCTAVAVDSAGNVFVTGHTQSSALTVGSLPLPSPSFGTLFVAKLNAIGEVQWAHAPTLTSSAPGDGSGGTGIAVDAQGDAYLCGVLTGTASFGPLSTQPYTEGTTGCVAKISAAGQWQWVTQAVGERRPSPSVQCTSIAVAAEGTAVVTGSFDSETAHFGAETLPNVGGGADTFVARLRPSGSWEWAVGVDDQYNDAGTSVVLDATGNAYVTGYFQGSSVRIGKTILVHPQIDRAEIFVAKVSPTGGWQWATSAGGPATDFPMAIARDSQGNLTVTGYYGSATATFGATSVFNTTGQYAYNVFLAQLDPSGNWRWALQAGGPGEDQGESLAIDGEDNVYVGGHFDGPVGTFGALTLAGNPYFHATGFLARVGTQLPLLLSGVSPTSGAAGQVVTLTGTRLLRVREVAFNGIPSPAIRILSATRLQATVPAGNTAGPITARTGGDAMAIGPSFQASVLATATATTADSWTVWPNPIKSQQVLQATLPGRGPAQLTLSTLLGQPLQHWAVSGPTVALPLLSVAPGLYLLHCEASNRAPVVQRLLIE